MATAIETLIEKPEFRIQLARCARNKVQQEFSLDAFVPKFFDLLQKCRIEKVGESAHVMA